MATTLKCGVKGLLGASCRQHVRLAAASAWYSKLPNPEGWEAVSGDVLAIHARNELRPPQPKKNHRPPWKPAWSAQPKLKKTLGGELVFGLHPVLLALRSRKRILYELHVDSRKVSDTTRLEQSPLLLQILDLAREQGLTVNGCSLEQIQRLCGGSNHQGVCLDASQLPVPLGDSLLDTLSQSEQDTSPIQPIWLYMDRIQDPMNFGAVLRSSCYFGVQKVFTPSKDSCRLSPTVSKASSGALELMELYVLQTPDKFLADLKSRGWWIVGTSSFHDPAGSPPSFDGAGARVSWDLPPPGRPVMLIVGNEGEGMKPEVSALCDTVLCVAPSTEDNPIGSLNVSVATGIVLHHLSTSRHL